MNEQEELRTICIDIPNKVFEINGVPIPKDCNGLTIHFENGIWEISETHRYHFGESKIVV
ncbi:hypothetical protein [Anaerocolumna sp. MB42-C2]|uniref:hypothetical protein n=1 Tax=Anaerocolumna sp. MB42-C2 TaxID=3070997 RepID=UPI0027DF3FFE|nr:hypothetical protein [Anaerocolumna sp. MB42-C2]WMJ85461.1 hypothetical protein RBU59_15430 [Anaerocolumna sp. MB42-C2]